MVEFGGWDMPVEYSRHRRRAHGRAHPRRPLRRVPHGRDRDRRRRRAEGASSTSRPTTPAALADGQIQYSALTTPQGTFVDDVLTYRLAGDHFMLVVNASNIVKDFHWIAAAREGSRAATRWP